MLHLSVLSEIPVILMSSCLVLGVERAFLIKALSSAGHTNPSNNLLESYKKFIVTTTIHKTILFLNCQRLPYFMRNRVVGVLIIIIAALIGFIIFSFNQAMTSIVNTSCSHGSSCPMWGTIDFQTNVSIGIMLFIVVIGFYLIFFSKEERIVTKIKTIRPQVESKKITKENYEKIMKDLSGEEKIVLGKIIESQGTIFQSGLVDKTKLNKVRVTRILDKLEGKNLIERRRRGMTNVIILKH